MEQSSVHTPRPATDWVFMALAATALVANFLWFETVERVALLNLATEVGGARNTAFLTPFLAGMSVAGIVGLGAPSAMERQWKRWSPWCAAIGCICAATIAYGSHQMPLAVVTATFVATGFVNVVLLLADTVLLAYIASRRLMSLAVIVVFLLRTACLCGIDVAPPVLTRIGSIALPIVCVTLTLAAAKHVGETQESQFNAHVRLTSPASHTMLTLLVLAAVAYAVTVSIMTFDYWQPGLFASIGPLPLLGGMAVFVVVAYFTLVATRSDFLMRFLPGLFVLLVANVLLGTLGTGVLQVQEPLGTMLGLFTGIYCETFSWLLLLYAVRMLKTSAFRLVGAFLLIESATEAVLYTVGGTAASGGLGTVIPMVLLVVLALIWNMHQLYQVGAHAELPNCASCPLRLATLADAQAAPSAANQAAPPEEASALLGDRRTLAASRGLSERETDVFVLLAQGYSRRYIGDELFISYGTVSTHTNRIYEKFGVHSKQELLTLVNGQGNEVGSDRRAASD